MIIAHRINTIEELTSLDKSQAIEFDVRDSDGKCIVQHDAFLNGVELTEFFQHTGNRFFIVNIKSEGIEKKVLDILRSFDYNDFFLLDCSFPKIVDLSIHMERRIAVRLSEYEDILTVLSLKDKVEWVWVDSFHNFILDHEKYKLLRSAGMKLCLVSPDLQKKPERIEEYVNMYLERDIFLDAVCCKLSNKSSWERYYKKIRRPHGFLVFHNGWTDIINSMGLIYYYAKRYHNLHLLAPEHTLELYKYILRGASNVNLVLAPQELFWQPAASHLISELQKFLNIHQEDYHLVGVYDVSYNGKYKNIFLSTHNIPFERKFYTCYDIPFNVRVNYFEVTRDLEEEDKLFKKIVKKEPYILTHFVDQNKKPLKEEYCHFQEETYELHCITPCMFYAIKLLMNAKEIHIIDSVWAAVCYHIDVKYRLLKDISITLHNLRYKEMFVEPIRLPNWKTIEY